MGEPGTKRIDGRILSHKDRTAIPFDTNATGSFIMDLPEIDGKQITIRDLFDRMANVNSKDTRRTMRGWLEEVKSKHAEEALNIERELKGSGEDPPSPSICLQDLVFWILTDADQKGKDPPNTGDIARILCRSKQQISNIKRKWKHRIENGSPVR